VHIVIRTAVATDAASLATFAARTFHDTYAADNRPEDMALHIAQSFGSAHQQRELANPNITTLIAEVDGQMAGYAQLRGGLAPRSVTGEAPVELWRFYVSHEWHGRGVAQALMQSVESAALRRGGRTLWLGVWEHNPRAKSFYQKCGFADVGSHVFKVGSDVQTDRVLVRRLATVTSAATADER
jgi:GNAT superfamily N-acetyltransferase